MSAMCWNFSFDDLAWLKKSGVLETLDSIEDDKARPYCRQALHNIVCEVLSACAENIEKVNTSDSLSQLLQQVTRIAFKGIEHYFGASGFASHKPQSQL